MKENLSLSSHKMDEAIQPQKAIKRVSQLGRFLNTGHPVVAVSTDDEIRFFNVEKDAILGRKKALKKTNALDDASPCVYRWGANGVITEAETGQFGNIAQFIDLVTWFVKEPSPGAVPGGEIHVDSPAPKGSVLFAFDAMFFLRETSDKQHSNAAVTREIKDSMAALADQKKTIFLINSGDEYVPPELKSVIPQFDYPDPDVNYLTGVVTRMVRSLPPNDNKKNSPTEVSPEDALRIAKLLLGFTETEAQNVLAESILENIKKRAVDNSVPIEFDTDFILLAKSGIQKNNPAIRVIMPNKTSETLCGKNLIGGSAGIKNWFMNQKKLFSPEAAIDGIAKPKGAVIFGMGGTGKDWFVEQMAQEVGWPLIHADLGAAMGHLQGQSHSNFRRILEYAESQAPCFLAISEWEKMMAGAMSDTGASCDGGVRQEILATWLNWMQNRTADVFIWGITNNIAGLSQASLRAGRWDCVWFMDLPSEKEREEIFSIHLKKRGWSDLDFNLEELSRLTDGYSGAEIDSIVNKAISDKFINEGPKTQGFMLTQNHLKDTISLVPSTSKTRGKEVSALREFAHSGGYPSANIVTSQALGSKGKTDLIKQLQNIAKT